MGGLSGTWWDVQGKIENVMGVAPSLGRKRVKKKLLTKSIPRIKEECCLQGRHKPLPISATKRTSSHESFGRTEKRTIGREKTGCRRRMHVRVAQRSGIKDREASQESNNERLLEVGEIGQDRE